jgi:thiol-disulfide isomerase/thioredoxin
VDGRVPVDAGHPVEAYRAAMPDPSDPSSGAATTPTSGGPGGLLRSLAHRLAGDEGVLPVEGRLPSFGGATGWLNSEPLGPEGLRGRVVLVDVWTYTCINWLRTLPYVRAWAAKYRDAGLTVVGVHTPEFGFERDVDNITARARDFGVEYPIAIDSDYGVWQALDNHFWPAAYLADAEGRIRFHHFGEGEYAMTEMAIQQLLLEAGATGIDQALVDVEPRGLEVAADWRTLRSSESYLGYRQANGFAQDESARLGERAIYQAPSRLPLNTWALSGAWTFAAHAAVSGEPGARIAFQFHARDVNLVMGPVSRGTSVPFRVRLEGEAATDTRGTDLSADATGTIDAQRTYQLIRQQGPIEDRRFEIEFLDGSVEAYCFTFG